MDCVSTTTNPELEWFSLDRGSVTLVLEMEIFDKIGAFINSGGGLVRGIFKQSFAETNGS